MPPKVKITREKIIDAAMALVREEGIDALNARAIATRLSCSTQPVFSNYPSMADLKIDLKRAVYDSYSQWTAQVINEGRYPVYKSSGMAYITFAMREGALFRLLFMSGLDQLGEQVADFGVTIRYVSERLGITEEKARMFHYEMWMCVHGMATLAATGDQSMTEELCSEMLTDIYNGLVMRFCNDL